MREFKLVSILNLKIIFKQWSFLTAQKLALLEFLFCLKLKIKDRELSNAYFLIHCALLQSHIYIRINLVGNCLEIVYIRSNTELPILPTSCISKKLE